MEAWRFGFGASMPPAYKFDPTDADIVAHYLLPRVAGLPNPPHAHVVVDADPCSCPPWELLRRHGHAGSDQAFFFGPIPKRTKTGRRLEERAVSEGEEGNGGGGGTWVPYRLTEQSLVLLHRDGGGGEMELRYKKRSLRYRGNEDARTMGWVMDEYEITDPPLHGAVLSRVMIAARGKKKKRQEQKAVAAAAQQLAPGPEHPGTSDYLDDDGPDAANYVVMGRGEGTCGGAQAEAVHQGDNSGGFLGEMAGYYSALPMPSAGEDGGYYVDNSNGGITFNYFSNNYCFNEGDGRGDYFLQDDGGNGD